MLHMGPRPAAGIHAIDMDAVAARLSLCGRERSNVGKHGSALLLACGLSNGRFAEPSAQACQEAKNASEVWQKVSRHGVARVLTRLATDFGPISGAALTCPSTRPALSAWPARHTTSAAKTIALRRLIGRQAVRVALSQQLPYARKHARSAYVVSSRVAEGMHEACGGSGNQDDTRFLRSLHCPLRQCCDRRKRAFCAP